MITYKKTELELVRFDETDVVGLIDLSTSVGWDYDEHEIGTVLSSGKIFGHKNAQGKIVSCAAIIPYDNSIASVGMVIVNKAYRGLGLGKKATQKCLDSVSADIKVMLIATEEGKLLYQNMGFTTVNYVHKYLCNSYKITDDKNKPNTTIEKYSEKDFAGIVDLDEAAFGDSRRCFLTNRIKQSRECLVVKDRKANITGYGISILGPVNLIIGPIVAPNDQTAALILDRLASDYQGKLRIDVPPNQDKFMYFLEQSGFVKVNQPPIMAINTDSLPPRDDNLYAIAAQVFG